MIENLSPYLAKRIVSDCEKQIIALATQVQDIEPQLKDYKEAYLKLQFDYDEAKQKLQQEKELVEWASKMLNGIPQKEKIRVMRGSSHNEMPENEKKRLRGSHTVSFTWTEYAINVLLEANIMMSEDELWNAMCNKYNVLERFESLDIKGGISKLKYGALHACIKNNSRLTKEGRPRGVLFEYRGFFGLKEWATDDFKPKGIYSSRFHQKVV